MRKIVSFVMILMMGMTGMVEAQTPPLPVLPLPLVPQNTIQRPGYRIQCFGDSRCANEISWGTGTSYGVSAGAQYIAYNGNGQISQAMHVLGGRLNFDYTLGVGPCPYNTGACFAVVSNPGAGYISPPVASAPGCPTVTFGPVKIANGQVVSIPITGGTATCAVRSGIVLTGGSPAMTAVAYLLSSSGGTWGFEGADSLDMLNLLPTVLPLYANLDAVVIACCVNDVSLNMSTATTMQNWITIVTAFLSQSTTVIIESPTPIGISGSVTAAQQQMAYDQAQRMREWVRGYSSQRPSGWGSIIWVDQGSLCGDQVSGATDGFTTKCSSDTVHLNNQGAWIIGTQVLAPLLAPHLGPNIGQMAEVAQNNAFSNTNNLTGPLPWGNFYSITGTGVSAPFTGNTPQGWNLQEFGSGTGTYTAGAEAATVCPGSTRSDCLSGSRFKLTISSGGGTAADQGQFTPFALTTAALGVTPVTDILYEDLLVDISNVQNAVNFFFSIQCQTGNGTGTILTMQDGFQPTNSNDLAGPQAGTKLFLQTPRAACPAGTNYITPTFGWSLNASGGANSASFTALMSNYAMRKVN